MNYHSVTILLYSFAVSVIIIPLMIYLSRVFKIYDRMDERKIHSSNISRLGGIGIFLGFIIPFVSVVLQNYNVSFNIYLFTAALILAFMIGLYDDIWSLKARYKFILQIIVGIMVACSGLLITEFSIFGFLEMKFMGIMSYIITAFWIVMFMNAINLLDGLDGLASGIVLIANLFIFYIALTSQRYFVAETVVILSGAILGFYLFNFPPAKIFMGDGGAYFLGFMYAAIPLMRIPKTSVVTIFLFPLVLLLVPLVDIIRVMMHRMKSGGDIFIADKNHLHHRLLKLGFSNIGILFIMYSQTIILGCTGILLLYVQEYIYILFTIVVLLILLFSYMLNTVENQIESYEDIVSKYQSIVNGGRGKS